MGTKHLDAMLAPLRTVGFESFESPSLGELQHAYDDIRNGANVAALDTIAESLHDVSFEFRHEIAKYQAMEGSAPRPIDLRRRFFFKAARGYFSLSFYGWFRPILEDNSFGPQQSVHPIELNRLGDVEDAEVEYVLRQFIAGLIERGRVLERARRKDSLAGLFWRYVLTALLVQMAILGLCKVLYLLGVFN